MKISALYFVSAFAVVTASKSCHREIDFACSSYQTTSRASDLLCNATYGSSDIVMDKLINFANTHIGRSFEYLMMSTHYGNYLKNRAGFEKLFRSLSDSKWESAIKLIQYITERGGKMQFEPPRKIEQTSEFELNEIQSIAKALDMEKDLAGEAFHVHKSASQVKFGKNDPEIASYIEKEFVHEHAKTIRKLSGYVSDLTKLLSVPDASLALFLFDEYLQKEYGHSTVDVIHSRKRSVYHDFSSENNYYFY